MELMGLRGQTHTNHYDPTPTIYSELRYGDLNFGFRAEVLGQPSGRGSGSLYYTAQWLTDCCAAEFDCDKQFQVVRCGSCRVKQDGWDWTREWSTSWLFVSEYNEPPTLEKMHRFLFHHPRVDVADYSTLLEMNLLVSETQIYHDRVFGGLTDWFVKKSDNKVVFGDPEFDRLFQQSWRDVRVLLAAGGQL